jgi:hypothetical protein
VPQEDGGVIEHTSQEDLHNVIWSNIHRKRFYLAEEAPLCSSNLRGKFGYNANTKIARAIVAGSYEYPPDFDQATREIFEECARIQLTILVDSVATTITPETWQSHWSKANENTSSSFSGRLLGCNIAGLRSDHVTMLHALVASLVTKRGIILDRWSKGLSVMLEKIFGCSLTTKGCSILLMEADFNATNKVVYGIRMLHNMCKYKLMPEEIYSERNCLADVTALCLRFYSMTFYDNSSAQQALRWLILITATIV